MRRFASGPAALLVAGLLAAPPASAVGGAAAPGPTHADLDAARRRVALLESELALARARKPYLVVDVQANRLSFALMGTTLREIGARAILVEGLVDGAAAASPTALAGILTLQTKEGDPRLTPLTPEQIEAGAADENVADALPPEIPAAYGLSFRQPVQVRVETVPAASGALTRAASFWRGLWGRRGPAAAVRVTIRLDENPARELYRALIPGERVILVAPPGLALPDAGQEAPRSIRPGRAAKPPAVTTEPVAPGVPFQIPPPVASSSEPEAPETAAGDGASPETPARAVPADNPAPVPADPPPAPQETPVP